jgi:hypothetical protein
MKIPSRDINQECLAASTHFGLLLFARAFGLSLFISHNNREIYEFLIISNCFLEGRRDYD